MRKQNQISSVGAAFGSFSHDLVSKKSVPATQQNITLADEEQSVPVSEGDQSPTPPLPISDQIDQSDLPQIERIDSIMQRSVDDVADRLDKCLGNVNPLLRDILYDFQGMCI